MARWMWPLFGLRLMTPRLELRLPTDDEIEDSLRSIRRHGIHDPAVIPFSVDWTQLDSPDFERQAAQFHWSQRAAWSPETWNLILIAFADGAPVGSQSVGAADFARKRSVSTGSWLLGDRQGQGVGKEMRAAVLTLAFDHLGAVEALSGARAGNEASLGVSAAMGYEPNGRRRAGFGDQVDEELMMRLGADAWETCRPGFDVKVEGLDACRDMFGV